jgi:hypothetical protein
MKDRVVAELAFGSKPHALRPLVRRGVEKVDVVELAALDRPVELQQEVDRGMLRPLAVGAQPLHVRRYVVGRRRVRHRDLMLQTFFRRLKRHRHVEDRLAVLLCHDSPGGERATVPDAVDVVEDGDRRVARAQEVPVKRVRDAPLDRAAGRDEGLCGDQASKDAGPAVTWAETAVEIDVEGLDVEAFEEAGEVGHPGEVARRERV